MTVVKDMQTVVAWNPPIAWVQQTIENAGTTIGSVHFTKRTNGEYRKMSYRLHVTKPSSASVPKGLTNKAKDYSSPSTLVKDGITTLKWSLSKKDIDKAHQMMTVLDANKVVKDEQGKIIGRGAWRTIPLENVVRIVNKGTEYVIKQY